MTPVSALASRAITADPRLPDDPVEAARQFEAVLVRQFVEVMTKDLFQGGEEEMMTGQADLQRDTLTDTLTEHLVDNGTFGIADLLMAQWERAGRVPAEPTAAPAEAGPRRAMSMDDALRLYQPTPPQP